MLSSNYELLLLSACRKKGFVPQMLGHIGKYPIWFIQTTTDPNNMDPKALVVSGFHGEEQAGPWGLLRWIQECTVENLKGINLSFIPVVNPWGFNNNTRTGQSGEATNAGFYRPGEKPSPEGQILKDNIGVIRSAAEAGYLSLHEDITSKEWYLYTFETSELPGQFTREMQEEQKLHFPKAYNGIAYADTTSGGGPPCKDGLVWKFFDGSFDDWMFQLGVPKVAVTETPGAYPLMERVTATVGLINRFSDLVRRGI